MFLSVIIRRDCIFSGSDFMSAADKIFPSVELGVGLRLVLVCVSKLIIIMIFICTIQ